MCGLVAATRSELQARFAARRGIDEYVMLAGVLDDAGTHHGGDRLW